MHSSRFWILLPLLSTLSEIAQSEELNNQRPAPLHVSESIRMFLAEQCLDCHQGDSAEGGLDLEGVSQGVSGGLDFSQWVRLHDRVADHEMPPPEDATIPNQEREHFLSVLSHELQALERAKKS